MKSIPFLLSISISKKSNNLIRIYHIAFQSIHAFGMMVLLIFVAPHICSGQDQEDRPYLYFNKLLDKDAAKFYTGETLRFKLKYAPNGFWQNKIIEGFNVSNSSIIFEDKEIKLSEFYKIQVLKEGNTEKWTDRIIGSSAAAVIISNYGLRRHPIDPRFRDHTSQSYRRTVLFRATDRIALVIGLSSLAVKSIFLRKNYRVKNSKALQIIDQMNSM